MKLVLHYLRFDWQRWRMLLQSLWGLLALHTWMVWMGHVDLSNMQSTLQWDSDVPRTWQNAAAICRGCVVLCAAMLCLFAGSADSPARGRTWQRTRPGRGWKLAAGHGNFVFMVVVVPLTVSYAASLAILRFNGPTIVDESLQMLGFASAAAAMLMLWAVMSPSIAGMVIGAGAAAGAGAICYLLGVRVPNAWLHGCTAYRIRRS